MQSARHPLATAAGLDVLAVLVFVVIGRRSHDEGSALRGVIETALPFLIGLGVAWAAARAWSRPTAMLTGITVWPITVLVAMLARRWLFERGTAASFVVVATLFLGACLVGWRLAANRLRRRQNSTATAGTS